MLPDRVTTLEACKYDDIAKYCKVFNINEIEYHVWIYLSPDDARNCVFLDAKEISPDPKFDPRFPLTMFKRESECWIRVVRDDLNLNPGKHTYKLSMVDRFTDTDFSLYISYYVQTDDPEKPYVYMKKEEEPWPPCPCKPEKPECEFTPYRDPCDKEKS